MTSAATTVLSAGNGSLHIGDTVLFLVKTRDYSGYVYSELSTSPYNFLTVYNLNGRDEKEPQFPNISYAAFKVMAPNKYKARQHLKKVEESRSDSSPNSEQCDDQQLEDARLAAQAEDNENEVEQQRHFSNKKKVVYGDQIQLQHIASKKYVRVCSEASMTESNNLLVSLSDQNCEECIFKILPRYKVRSEGDDVRFNDQLKIESVKNQGQFLHCSGLNHTLKSSKFKVLTDCFELNLSSTESALTLIPHYCPSTSKYSDKALRAGNCVRLFHKEDECYIAAEGSFARFDDHGPVIENVHCRLRRVASRKHAAPSTSANTYWQIEKQEDSRSGEVIAWGERCRLKHLPTRCYLAVVKDFTGHWKVKLKNESSDDDLETIFTFSPLIEEGEEVLLESYALLKHPYSEQWLHLEKSKYKRNKAEGLQWDSAELFMLTTSKDRGDYDSFALQKVTEDLIDRFNYVAGIVPVLTGYIKLIHDGMEVKQKLSARVRGTLEDLKNWLVTNKERDTKNNQKLLRNLRILDQLAVIVSFQQKDKDEQLHELSSHHADICRESYSVIQKFLEGESRKNENYLARFIPSFLKHVRKELNAEVVLIEIVQGNLMIVTKMANENMKDMIMEFLKTEDPRFLHFLGSLCVCNDRPIPSTQNRLLEQLVEQHGKDKFLKTIYDKETQECYCYEPSTPAKLIPLNELKKADLTTTVTKTRKFSVASEGGKKKKNLYEHLEAQLYLLGKLCQGNNKTAIEKLVYSKENPTGYISFDEALYCVNNLDIDPTIRSRYIELILVMFVDVGENRPFLDHLCYSFPYKDLVPSPYADSGGSQIDAQKQALTGVKNDYFPSLKTWIQSTLENNTVLYCESPENASIVLTLDVLGHFVRFGYYDDVCDVDDVLTHLIEMLNGASDEPSKNPNGLQCKHTFESDGRKKDTPENKEIFAVKIKALEVMELLHRFKFYVKLQKFLYNFKVVNNPDEIDPAADSSSVLTREIFSKLMTSPPDPDDKCSVVSPDVTSVVRDDIESLCDGCVKGGGFAPRDNKDSLELVLLDLSEYECDELVTASLNLLTQMYFFEEELFSKAHQSQLLTSAKSLEHYKQVNEKILPELRQLLRVDTSGDTQDRIIQLLQNLQSLCLMPSSSGTSIQPNRENQIMLNNFGIVSDVMNFVFENGHGSNDGVIQGSVGENLFCECLRFLRHLTADNLNVQKQIFNQLGNFLEIKLPTAALADLADLITEIFAGGHELILKVTKHQVDNIFEIIINSGSDLVQAHFMITLEAIAKIEEVDLPVGCNQALIIKNFCRVRHALCQELLGETPEMEEKIMKVLLSDQDCHASQLQLLLNTTDMLAACAEGKNLFIESVCQKVFSAEELIKILNSPLPLNRKRPFVRFLVWVYMNVESDRLGAQKTSMVHENDMWSYLEQLSNLLENTAKVLLAASPRDVDSLQQELHTNIRRRKSYTGRSASVTSSDNQLPHLSIEHIPGVTDEEGQLVPGLLEYLADGVIPFLYAFYSHFFNPESTRKTDQQEKEYRVSALIVKSLLLLGKSVQVFTSDKHINMYRETINALCKLTQVNKEANLTEEQIQSVDQAIALAQTCIVKKVTFQVDEAILDEYNEQQELNDLFNTYSHNYHYFYMGSNTPNFQIHSPVPATAKLFWYSDEGEELPLGPSFQALVKLYRLPEHAASKKELLRQLEISFRRTERLRGTEQASQDVLDIRCLQILRALIHNEIKMIDPELKDEKPKEFRNKCNELVRPVQNCIQNFGNGISRVMRLLSHTNESIAREALALMKAMLFAGNKEVQEGLTIAVRGTREEKLFLSLKSRLEITGDNYKEMIVLKRQLESRKLKEPHELLALKSPSTTEHMESFKQDPECASIVHSSGKEVAIQMETLDSQPLISSKPSTLQRSARIRSSLDHDESPFLSNVMKHDAQWADLALEVIGLMCDGQHRTLQNYLREQADNFQTTNVVAEVVTFLHTFTADLSRNLEQISEILQALIEMCVGNVKNQVVVYDKLVMDALNKILQMTPPLSEERESDPKPEKEIRDFIQVEGRAVELLDVLLENISPQTTVIAKGIGLSLNVNSVLRTMGFFYKLEQNDVVKELKMDDDCRRGMYKAHHVLVTLIDLKAISIKNEKELEKIADSCRCKDVFDDSTKFSRTIEIHYEEEGAKPIISKVYFPYDPEDVLREEVTELVRWSINRDSMEDKQRSLLELMPALKQDIKHQTWLKGNKIMEIFLAYPMFRAYLLILLTVILSLFVLFIYTVPDSATRSNRVFLPPFPLWALILFYILGVGHLILSVWIVVEYFIINFPHFKFPAFVYSMREKFSKFMVEENRVPGFVSSIRKRILKADNAPQYKPPNLTCIDVNFFGVSTLYMIFLLCCSILSLVFRGYFYCFCLLFIIKNSDILKRVLQAVTKNGISLVYVAVLGVIVLFIYAVISFALLHNNFVETDDAALYCASLGQCMYSVLRYGLTDNLGLLIPFQRNGSAPDFTPGFFTARLIFDLSFFIIVTTIGLNIVFGIIVDTFSELREERSNIETEQKSNCFICDLPSYDFERSQKAKGFANHVKYDHNMWNYIYYSYYLDNIDTGDHNAIQKYVYELIGNEKTKFFPQNEACRLVGEEDATGEKIEELHERVQSILQHFREKEHKKSISVKKQERQKKWDEQVKHVLRSSSGSVSFEEQQ